MQNFTLQGVIDACNLGVSHKEQQWRENIQATHLLQLVHLVYLMIEVTEGGKDVHVLITTDHFIRYAKALVTSSQTAKYTAWALWHWFEGHNGLPESIIPDQGCNSKSDLISELYKLAKVWKLHIGPYHQQTNGQCEHFDQTLINMLCTLPPNKKSS